jgi:hypothetical protein
MEVTQNIYSAMQSGAPFRVYKKNILAKVFVQVINPFSGEPEGVLLKGNHRNNDAGCFIQLWSEREHEFFKRMNQLHLKKGYLIPVNVDEFVKMSDEYSGIDYSQFTDNDIDEILNAPFLSLRAHLNKSDSEPHVLRVLDRAEELGKSDKITAAIKSRLSEIQIAEYTQEE